MTQKLRIRISFVSIFLLIIIAAIFDFPSYYNQFANLVQSKTKFSLPRVSGKPFLLGLDLQGGTHLIYEADVSQITSSERQTAIEGVKDVLDRRVNAFGVSEPIIQSSRSGDTWNVIVELAGISDVNQAIKMIGETPLLNFKLQNPVTEPILSDQEKKDLEALNKSIKLKADDILKKSLKPDADFTALAKEFSEDTSKDAGGMLGFAKKGVYVSEFEKICFDELKVNQISQSVVQTKFGYHIIKKIDEQGEGDAREVSCQHILLKTKTPQDIHPVDPWVNTELSGEHLKKAQVVFDPNTQAPQVSLEFNSQGKELFKQLTTDNVGKVIGIFLDGEVISAPRVNEPIVGGNAVISGNFGIQEAKVLSQRLNAGALRVPIKLVSQQTIGPTLGKISVKQSVTAAIFGLLIVSLFMIIFYRIPGLLADISLLSYGFIILSLFKLIPVTLTLAGISGFILSIGIAVDANILIFERMKEEIKRGRSLDSAIDEAFKRAWPSIRDGNISTLITCIILIWFSTSIVKGFAITLIIGILVSIFSAMFITKIFLKMIVKKGNEKWLWMYGVNKRKI